MAKIDPFRHFLLCIVTMVLLTVPVVTVYYGKRSPLTTAQVDPLQSLQD
jgi:hypothetical protein